MKDDRFHRLIVPAQTKEIRAGVMTRNIKGSPGCDNPFQVKIRVEDAVCLSKRSLHDGTAGCHYNGVIGVDPFIGIREDFFLFGKVVRNITGLEGEPAADDPAASLPFIRHTRRVCFYL